MLYQTITEGKQTGRKYFSVLLDPDKCSEIVLFQIIKQSVTAGVDFFLLGGSLLFFDRQQHLIGMIREKCDLPVILFPGNNMQINVNADGILLLSLISGRNPELLIGQHVTAAPLLKASSLEIIPTGYLLIDSGKTTSVNYMSQTMPIPAGKNEIAVCTAMAGEMLGLKMIYLDAGSGAPNPVPESMIQAVKNSVNVPVMVGGGITTPALALKAYRAGADIVVAGNIFEQNPELISAISSIKNNF